MRQKLYHGRAMPFFHRRHIAFIALVLSLLMHYAPLQAQDSLQFGCGTIRDTTLIDTTGTGIFGFLPTDRSPMGWSMTPHDSIRVLIVYAGFTSIAGDSLFPLYRNHDFDAKWLFNPDPVTHRKPLPVYNSGSGVVYDNYGSIDTSHDLHKNPNLSNFFYEMSRHSAKPLKFIGTAFPERIDVHPTRYLDSIGGFSGYNQMVWDSIQARIDRGDTLYKNFNWRQFDRRKNSPHFLTDCSAKNPDKKIDYVIMLWRYATDMNPTSFKLSSLPGSSGGYDNYESNGAVGLYLRKDTVIGGNHVKVNIDTFFRFGEGRAGLTISCAFSDNAPGVNFAIKHEMMHNVLQEGHQFGANGVTEGSLHSFIGWGMMSSSLKPFETSNSWESYLLGWHELETGPTHVNSDIQDSNSLPSGHQFVLRDYVTSGDILRIKFPGTPQYIWLENHQAKSAFEKRMMFTESFLPSDTTKGLFAFNDKTTNSRIDPPNMTSSRLKALNGEGNVDYIKGSLYPHINPSFPGNWFYFYDEYDFTKRRQNAFIGESFLTNHREDINNNGELETAFNSPNSGSGTETVEVMHENGNWTYPVFDFKRSSLVVGKTYSSFSNPPLVNFSAYRPANYAIDSTFIYGIAVKVVSQNAINKSYTLQVEYNHTKVLDSTRWAGNISLRKISAPGSGLPDMDIQSGVTLTVDRSATPNTHFDSGTVGGVHFTASDFIRPTTLVARGNTFVNLKMNARLEVKGGSTMILRKGAKLELGINSVLVVNDSSKLIFEGNNTIILHDGAKIIAKDDSSKIIYGRHNTLTMSGDTPSIQIFGTLVMKDTTLFKPLFGGGSGYIRFVNSNTAPFRDNLIMADGDSFYIYGYSKSHLYAGGFEGWRIGGSYNVKTILENTTIRMECTDVNKPRVNVGSPITMVHVDMRRKIGNSGGHRGLHIYGQGGVNLEWFSVSQAETGILAYLVGSRKKPYIEHFQADSCMVGIKSQGWGLDLRRVRFNNCFRGWWQIGAEVHSMMYGEVDDKNFYSSYILSDLRGVNYFGTRAASLDLQANIIGAREFGVSVEGSPLGVHCMRIDSSKTGVRIANGAVLYAGRNMGPITTGGLHIGNTKVDTGIYYERAFGVYADSGYNDFRCAYKDWSGSMYQNTLKGGATSIATFNDWNNPHSAPGGVSHQSDVRILPASAGALAVHVYDDPDRSGMDYCAPHDTAFYRSPMSPGDDSDAVKITSGGTYDGYGLPYAWDHILNTTPGEMDTCQWYDWKFDVAWQMQTSPYDSADLNQLRREYIDHAYFAMLDNWGLMLERKCNFLDMEEYVLPHIAKVEQAQHKMIVRMSYPGNFYNPQMIQTLYIDRAGMFRSVNLFDSALVYLDSASAYAQTYTENFYINKWKCMMNFEKAVFEGSISKDELESHMECDLDAITPPWAADSINLEVTPNPTLAPIVVRTVFPRTVYARTEVRDHNDVLVASTSDEESTGEYLKSFDLDSFDDGYFRVTVITDSLDSISRIIIKHNPWVDDTMNLVVTPNPTDGPFHAASTFSTVVRVRTQVFKLDDTEIDHDTEHDGGGLEYPAFDITAYPDGFYKVKMTVRHVGSLTRIIQKKSDWSTDSFNVDITPDPTTGPITVSTTFPHPVTAYCEIRRLNGTLVYASSPVSCGATYKDWTFDLSYMDNTLYRATVITDLMGSVTKHFGKMCSWQNDSTNVTLTANPTPDTFSAVTNFDCPVMVYTEVRDASNSQVAVDGSSHAETGFYMPHFDIHTSPDGYYRVNMITNMGTISRSLRKVTNSGWEMTSSNVTVYPNPTSSTFYASSNFTDYTHASIVLRDVYGTILAQSGPLTGSGTLGYAFDLTYQASGVYYLTFYAEDKYITKMVVRL